MKKYKKLTALLLAAVMTLSLAACGKGKNVTNGGREYTYVPEYIEMGEDVRLYNTQFSGDSMYYLSDSFDEATQTYRSVLCEYSLTDRKTTREVHMAADEERRNLSHFYVLEDGTFLTTEMIYNENSRTVLLCAYDSQGSRTQEEDISDKVCDESGYGYVDTMLVDGEGRIYIQASEGVCLFGKDFSYQGRIDSDTWIDGLCMDADGKIYGTYYDNSSDARNYCLAEIDFAGKKWGTVYNNLPQGQDVVAGKDADFLIRDNYGVYAYDMEKQTGEKLFDWLDSDINGDYVDSLNITKDGRLVIVLNDWESGENNLAFLDKKKTSELPRKTEIVVATITSSQELQAAAVAFNKQSDAYHVSIKTYVDNHAVWTETTYSDAVSRLKSDLVSGSNSPDIVYMESALGNIEKLALNGAFEDLFPYLEKSSVLSKDDYLENVLGTYTYGGKLAGIPKTFYVSTIVGKTSDFGGKKSWTVEDMIAYADAHPGKDLFEYATRQSILQLFLQCNSKLYIDYSTGKCNFASQEFQNLLAFVKNIPGDFNWDEEDQRSTPLKLQAGDVLLEMVSISDFDEIQLYEAMFNEPVTCIGFPAEEGSSGCLLSVQGGVGISAKAKNKEGAWTFVEHYLTTESRLYNWGISARKSKMQEAIDAALKDSGGNGIGYGDWEYTYHTPTKEEVNLVVELIESATAGAATDDQILNIITEEAEPFFQGQKSIEDVTDIIQRRVQLYLDENQ
ncbi:MAG: extracellular solute-binding protein [Clostridium sp.]|nr:extracellular solute-binding protein [Clostridium sp.]